MKYSNDCLYTYIASGLSILARDTNYVLVDDCWIFKSTDQIGDGVNGDMSKALNDYFPNLFKFTSKLG